MFPQSDGWIGNNTTSSYEEVHSHFGSSQPWLFEATYARRH